MGFSIVLLSTRTASRPAGVAPRPVAPASPPIGPASSRPIGCVPRPVGPECGSQTTEYALIMVVAATIASLALAWARSGAIAGLLTGVLEHVRSLFGMG